MYTTELKTELKTKKPLQTQLSM